MSTNGRKGNRTSIPARGGARRSNTAPPPSVRISEVDPISTSRPRGPEGQTAPVLGQPPADIVAAAAAAQAPAEPEATTKTPPVVVAPAAAPVPPPREPLPTLVSRPESISRPGATSDPEGPMSQPAPSVAPRNSMTGAPGAVRRKGRGSNLRTSTLSGRSYPPPATTSQPPPARAEADVASTASAVSEPPVSSRATLPVEASALAASAAVPEAQSTVPPPSGLDENFFEHGDRVSHAHEAHREDPDLETYDERMAHKNSPAARARREQNWTYIRWAAGICVVVMGAALVRNATRHEEVAEPPPVVTVAAQHPVAVPSAAVDPGANVMPEPSAGVAPPASALPAASAIPTASAEDLPAAAAAPSGSARFQEPTVALGTAAKPQGTDPATAAPVAVAVPADPTEAEKKSATQEKRSCQTLLDQGAFKAAVEAGERSVALDPADGEAWLMLGAAYQSMGKSAEARRSFSSCVAEAKKGPINECRAMLR